MTTLHIRIEPSEEFDDRVAAKLRAVDEDRLEELDGERMLSLPEEESLDTVLSGKNLELIRATAGGEPGSMRELARLVDRDIKNVSRAVNELAELGLMELDAEGRAKRPRVPYDEIEVTYPLGTADPESRAPA